MSLILKPGHDPKVASLHRPISLLPIEIKIIGKVLASRLKECTGLIIHSDQTSFMPGRHTYRNLRCLFDILYTKHTEEAAVISLDAQRAFDQVEWPYMMFALKKFWCGPSFMKWIEIIYSNLTASVITNQNICPPFAVNRGTCQSCPLSPFLLQLSLQLSLSRWLLASDKALSNIPPTCDNINITSRYMLMTSFCTSQPYKHQ